MSIRFDACGDNERIAQSDVPMNRRCMCSSRAAGRDGSGRTARSARLITDIQKRAAESAALKF